MALGLRRSSTPIQAFRAAALALMGTLAAGTAWGQAAGGGSPRVAVWENLQAATNSEGQTYLSDTSVALALSQRVTLSAGLPIYDVPGGAGLGDIYARLNVARPMSWATLGLQFTATAPTGNTSLGLSTGRFTGDFTGRLSRWLGPLHPFVAAGIANTVPETLYYLRQYTSLGLVGHVEAGSGLWLTPTVSVGASGYDILPSGQQKIFSHGQNGATTGKGPAFLRAGETVGGADLARDDGVNAWAAWRPQQGLALELSYSHSARYALNTVAISLGYNLANLFGSSH